MAKRILTEQFKVGSVLKVKGDLYCTVTSIDGQNFTDKVGLTRHSSEVLFITSY